MRNPVLSLLSLVNFIKAILKQDGELFLYELQLVRGGLDAAGSAPALGNLKGPVFCHRCLLEQDVGERGRLELQ